MKYLFSIICLTLLLISCSKDESQKESRNWFSNNTSVENRNDHALGPQDGDPPCTVVYYTDWFPVVPNHVNNDVIDIIFNDYTNLNWMDTNPYISCGSCHAQIYESIIEHDDDNIVPGELYMRIAFKADCNVDCEYSFADCVRSGSELCFTAGAGEFHNPACFWTLGCQSVETAYPPLIETNSGIYDGPTPSDYSWVFEAWGFTHPDDMDCDG